jgi:hypothetical protein
MIDYLRGRAIPLEWERAELKDQEELRRYHTARNKGTKLPLHTENISGLLQRKLTLLPTIQVLNCGNRK